MTAGNRRAMSRELPVRNAGQLAYDWPARPDPRCGWPTLTVRQPAMAARGYTDKDPESTASEAEARLPYAGPEVSPRQYRATRGSMQITLIWTLHSTVGFEATTVHIGRVGARSPRPRLSLSVTGDRHHLNADLRSSRGQTCCDSRTICGGRCTHSRRWLAMHSYAGWRAVAGSDLGLPNCRRRG